MFTELEKLGIENYRGGITNIFPNRTQHVWSVNNLAEGKSVKAVGTFNIDDHPFWQLMFHDWESKQDFTWYFLAGDDKEKYIKILNATQGYLPQAFQQFPDVHFQVYYFNEGAVWTNSLHKHTDEEQQVMKRFTSVFSLTFRRYQDLKKAEAQAREAKIEAAMEKVRARAMAMQKPGELEEVAVLLRKEMALLGVEELETSSLYIHDENAGTTDCWYAIKDIRENDTRLVTDHMTINLNDTWVGREMLEFYNSGQNQTSILMKGENRKEWITYCSQHSRMLQGYYGDTIPERTYHLVKFSNGYMGAASPGDISKESWDLLKRATSVFSLAYTRFSDLQKSEANAREAVKQAALDRIRADIASMRTKTDLDRITPLIWKELTILGLPFIRCGVFIMDDSQQLIHTFLSTPEGQAIAAFHLPYNTPGNFSDVIEHWRSKKVYINHWNEADFLSLAETLVNQGAIANKEQYLNTLPEGGFYLHLLPFMQGMFYVGNSTRLNEEEIKLIQSVADAFSTAYARYEDFNKLEAAKQQVERTLTELKQAQQQLVQSEKMASLGELTAGIAHEIQNPLNFVNNFSEVSKELLDEMKEAIEKGDTEDAKEIMNDVIQNLEKINHHGKRADGIVKGMLQHSRTSSGQKELTDINALCDEYLRLAYHGLRAKDKSFNAKFETDFDETVGKLNVIPQDIGRVVLNLINNAFYVVSERKKLNEQGYEPTVSVSTFKEGDTIKIKVSDNGTGIPQKVLDKIFQPFFTTKPTGQGTGLGLSLSYDIVKAHGGELNVETRGGEGTEFIILLPG
jgi:signal transduction histidine kinase